MTIQLGKKLIYFGLKARGIERDRQRWRQMKKDVSGQAVSREKFMEFQFWEVLIFC